MGRPRVSLRGMMLIVLAISLAMGFVQKQRVRGQAFRDFAHQMNEKSAIGECFIDDPNWYWPFERDRGTGRVSIRRLTFRGCYLVKGLYLSGPEFGDETLLAIANFGGPRDLRINGIRLTERGLDSLKWFVNMRLIIVRDCEFGEKGCLALSSLPNLVAVGFKGCHLSSRSLEYLSQCQRLDSLCLNDVRVSRVGLMNMMECKTLNHLAYSSHSIDPDTLRMVQEIRPDIEVECID
jgi:hypothetical protein